MYKFLPYTSPKEWKLIDTSYSVLRRSAVKSKTKNFCNFYSHYAMIYVP
jgi:hypothetical protein